MWPAYSHSILVDGARASCRWMDAWGARHSYRSLVMLSILAQAKFLREAEWANEVPLQVQTRTAWFRVGNPGTGRHDTATDT
jgi:hypothetical protein